MMPYPAALALVLLASPLAAEPADDFLMGSVVKSDKWKMDRVNEREIFDGNVSFRNALYSMKSDYAVYDHRSRFWNLKGSVYFLRKFADGGSLELRCGAAEYDSAGRRARLFRNSESIRMLYRDAQGRTMRGACDRISAEENSASMDFAGNFRLATRNMELFSDQGRYEDRERSFDIRGSSPAARGAGRASKPVAEGARDGRRFALTGERIKFFRDTGDVKLYNDVAGWVDAGEGAEALLTGKGAGKR